MDKNLENVKQAKESFEHVLGKNKYTNIIKDDKHLSVILNMLDGDYGKILARFWILVQARDIWLFPYLRNFPKQQ